MGMPCPSHTRGHKDFTILHTNGIHTLNVDFCGCENSPPHRDQLLEVGWWPSTPLEPQSAATMHLLRSFHTWNLQGQISPTDFYRGLEQLTCGDGLLSIPVRAIIFSLLRLLLNNIYVTGSTVTMDAHAPRMAAH